MARKFGKGLLLFGYYRISAMQINWFYSDCNFRYICCTNFFELHCAFLVFANFVFRLLVLLALLECAGGFRSCGSDHGLCPLDSHKPLIKAKPVFAAAQTFLRKASRLDRNFKCFGTVTFVWLGLFCAALMSRLLSLGSHFLGRVQK